MNAIPSLLEDDHNKGVPASPSDQSGSAPSPEGLGHTATVPNAELLAKFSAWIAYVKDEAPWAKEPEIKEFEALLALAIAGERKSAVLRSAVLRIAIQKLPEFSAHWTPERRDQWFDWFFDLLEQASAIEAFGQDAKRLDAEHESAVPKGDAQ